MVADSILDCACGAPPAEFLPPSDQTDPPGRRDDLTYKANLQQTRFGWLRMTPAFSVHLVRSLLERTLRPGTVVLDPFCGTGTTAVVCAERGIPCDTTDINPFLVWLTKAKTRSYSASTLARFTRLAGRVSVAMLSASNTARWVPTIHQIEKW